MPDDRMEIAAIRTVLAANDAAIRPEPATLAAWADCFAPDGAFELEGAIVRGQARLLEFHRGMMTGGATFPLHLVGTAEVAIAGDEADAVSLLALLVRDGETWRLATTGRYRNRLTSADGSWRIAHRPVEIDGGASPAALASTRAAGGPG